MLTGFKTSRTVFAMTLLCAAFLMPQAASMYAQELVILHTNDTHSHIDPVKSGPEAGLGGVI